MKKFTTYSEIENLCEAMIKDFMKRKYYTNAHCVDIEAFVTEYLGIPIVYETFAEPDPGRIGFLSDGIRPLWVVRGNEKKQVLFPKNTVVLKNTCKHKLKSEGSVSRLLMREHTLSSPNIFRLKQMPMQLFTASLTRKWFIPRKCSEKCFQSTSRSETELRRVF